MFKIQNEYSKTVKSILTDTEIKRKQSYTIPQFGAEKVEADTVEANALSAVEEAIAYFGAAEFVRHLNWSLTVAAQRRANNDLRTSTAGLNAADQASVTLLLNLAKRTAEAECGATNEKGEMVVDRKSAEYATAMRESLEASLARPKFAHLRPVFEGASESGETLTVDLTAPGSLNAATDEATATE